MSDSLAQLFHGTFGEPPSQIQELRAHASERSIFRLRSSSRRAIGVINGDLPENRAFIEFSRHFRSHGLPVPEVYAQSDDGRSYLQQDLGDLTLYDFLDQTRTNNDPFPLGVEKIYSAVMRILPSFQIDAGRDLNYSFCHQRPVYDAESMLIDMRSFRDSFLPHARVSFDQEALNRDFERFAHQLAEEPCDFFLYRDLQARNIMIYEGSPYFIDFQAGRQGALQYDIASLLYQAKARLPQEVRDRLLGLYLDQVESRIAINRQQFLESFDAFVLLRQFQVLGLYARQGIEKGKNYFAESIPIAVGTVERMLERGAVQNFTELRKVLEALVTRYEATIPRPALSLVIRSFSYKHGIPSSGDPHGGGFVFDCRCLPNPGRLPEYAPLTGLDAAVQNYLEGEPVVGQFFENVAATITLAVERYIARGYGRLSVQFGCTGGQHRSVRMAERLAERLRTHAGVHVTVEHIELKAKNLLPLVAQEESHD